MVSEVIDFGFGVGVYNVGLPYNSLYAFRVTCMPGSGLDKCIPSPVIETIYDPGCMEMLDMEQINTRINRCRQTMELSYVYLLSKNYCVFMLNTDQRCIGLLPF